MSHKNTHMSSRIIDYSKWDQLKYSSSEEDDDDEGEKESAEITRSALPLENLSLCSSSSSSSSPIWNGLVLHHKDVFVSHVLPKLNGTDRRFFSKVNGESLGVLAYAGVDVSKLGYAVHECTSISTLEWAWNNMPWGEKDDSGNVLDQAWFCAGVAGTNKFELFKWAREVKHCEWDEWTIKVAADKGNLEMLKYCFSKDCPYDEEESCVQAVRAGHLDCRFVFDKVKPSRDTEEGAAVQAAAYGHLDIMKYFVEERKISAGVKSECVYNASGFGHFDCLKYLVEEARAPLNDWRDFASARYKKHTECENYLLEKGCPEPTDEDYARFSQGQQQRSDLE